MPQLSYSGDEASYSTTTTSTSSTRSSSPVDSALTSASPKPSSDSIGPDEAYFTSGSSETIPTSLPVSGLSQEQDASSFSIPSFTDNSSRYQVPIAEEPEQYVTASPEKNDGEQEGSNSRYPSPDTGPPALPTYLPTPKTPSLPAQPVKADVGVPVYQPTPKRELKRRHGDHVKGKVKLKGTDMEYDPECNYSCGGFTKSNKDQPSKEDGDLDYKPTKKKPRTPGPVTNRKMRLSCESLVAYCLGAVEESEDEEMNDGEFSEEENDSESTPCNMEEGMGQVEVSEDFENIGDEDISSDDEFIDVPDLSLTVSDLKSMRNSLVKSQKKGTKDSKPVSEREKMSSDGTKHKIIKSEKTISAAVKVEQKRTSKDSASKSSTSSSKSQSSNSAKSKPDKSSRSSSHKGTTSSSSSAKVYKQDSNSKKSSSTSAKGLLVSFTEAPKTSKQSSKDKSDFSSKAAGDKIKHKNGSPSKIILSGKLTSTSSKSSSSSSSLSRKHSSSEAKSSSSSHKHSSASGCSDTKRRSSLDGTKTSSSNARKPSCESKTSGEKHLSTDTKNSSSVKQSNLDCKFTSTSGKHASSDTTSTKTSSVAKHSSSNSKASLSNRRSSSDSKAFTSDTRSNSDSKISGQHSHNSSSALSGKDLSIKPQSKDGSSRSSKSRDRERKGSTEHPSGRPELHMKNSSSGAGHSRNQKTQRADSSSHHKGEKSSKKKSSSNSKDGTKLLVRMNSNLFGDDSDGGEGVAENTIVISDSDVGETGITTIDDPSTSGTKMVEEEKFVDYSSYINDSDFEDEDTFDECLRIFKEDSSWKKPTGKLEKKVLFSVCY